MARSLLLTFKGHFGPQALLQTKGEVNLSPALEKELLRPNKGPYLACRQCGHKITPIASRISVSDRHIHVCSNPHGLVFEIGCFAHAPGCTQVGLPSIEFTWFPGHTWQITLCEACHNHLGWLFQQSSGAYFYGLILQRLTQTEGTEK